MKSFVAALLLGAFLLAGASVSHAQVSNGVRIGPPAPRVVRALPPRPGPDDVGVEGYWYPVGNHYKWHAGYWTRPPYAGARWIGPRFEGEQFYYGYWDGDHGRFEHDHRWDRDHDRDFDRDRDRDRDHR